MKIRFKNVRLLTMNNGNRVDFGELWTEDDKITYVGPACNSDDIKESFDREIDGNGNVLMPGFKNAHTHSGMTAMRSYADDLPLQEWLETMIFPMEAIMTGDDIYTLTKLGILEYLTTGVTSIMDMYLDPYYIAKSCEDAGMRVVQVSGINKFGPSLEELENRYNVLNNKHPLSSFMLGFHAEYTCELDLLKSVAALAHKYQAPVFAHNSETESETRECFERYHMSPTALMDSLGMFEYGGGGYHCVYFNDEDIEIFKKHDLSIVTNPGSNTKLASGIAPISKFLKAGVNVAIGTDGPSSNNCLDMFREMFLVTGLAKLKDHDASAVPGYDVLKMATVSGAKAMGLFDCDSLQVGKQADIIMIDLHQPNMQPILNIPENIVYSGSKQNVKMTMIAGKILYEDNKFFIDEDAEDIYAKANDIIGRLKKELGK